MEATGVYWKPVWHILADGDVTLILANAAHVKNVPGRKTDVADAVWLSDLLAHGLIRASFVPEPATQSMRSLLRTRKQLVREQASHIQRLQKTLEDANIKLSSVLASTTETKSFCRSSWGLPFTGAVEVGAGMAVSRQAARLWDSALMHAAFVRPATASFNAADAPSLFRAQTLRAASYPRSGRRS